VTSERDQFVNMLEQRNKQFGEISLACERSNMQVWELIVKFTMLVTLLTSVLELPTLYTMILYWLLH